jgi:hypothetical protein
MKHALVYQLKKLDWSNFSKNIYQFETKYGRIIGFIIDNIIAYIIAFIQEVKLAILSGGVNAPGHARYYVSLIWCLNKRISFALLIIN